MPSPESDNSPDSSPAGAISEEKQSSSTAHGDKDQKKTKRIQLSCTFCRHRKLKCNRLQPCENCIKRGQAQSCHYANPGPRKTPAHARLSARNNELQNRLMHLEELVVSLSNRKSDSPEAMAAVMQVRQTSPKQSSKSAAAEHDTDSPGRMVTDPRGTRYVDSSDWRAMLEEIALVKKSLEESDDEDEEPEPEEYASRSRKQGAPLLLGAVPAATKAELLQGMPSRTVVDQLVTRWFNGKDPSLMCIHIPTFMKEYDRFWKEPRQTPTAWIAILYSMIWLGTSFYVRTGEVPPADVPADPNDLLDVYLQRTAQALTVMDYTVPGKHKVEALMIYFGVEYLRYRDAQSGLAFIIAAINRLAMLSGYHRDPKHFPNLTCYEGEMRRRAWAVFRQIEVLIAFQVGLPRLIQDWQSDTEPPRNLHNEDFDEDCQEMPPARPETDRTSVTYQIGKGRMMEVFGQISDRTFSMEKMSYDEVMLMDMRTRESYDALPAFLHLKPLNLCLTDPPELVMQRYNLQFLFQKARCVLHRRYFTATAVDPRSIYSKKICVEAAMEILKHQKDLYDATQPGGILGHDSWYISSLTTHDFVMASMILCLWLSREAAHQEPEAARIQVDSKLLFHALESSYQVWTSLKSTSYEAYKAAEALALMLKKTRARRQADTASPMPTEAGGFGSLGDANEGTANTNGSNTFFGGFMDQSRSTSIAGESSTLSQSLGTPGTTASFQDSGNQSGNTGINIGAEPSSSNAAFDASGLSTFANTAFGIASDSMLNPELSMDMDWTSWDLGYRGQSVDVELGDLSWMNEVDVTGFPELNLGTAGQGQGQGQGQAQGAMGFNEAPAA